MATKPSSEAYNTGSLSFAFSSAQEFSFASLSTQKEVVLDNDNEEEDGGGELSLNTRSTTITECNINNDVDQSRECLFNASSESDGSSIRAAIFNFTNAIVGAGAIGLGGAFALSGGIISIASILVCAMLTKASLDLVLEMSLLHGVSCFEDLGYQAFGKFGRYCVLWSKMLYSYGCLVAYIIVIKDNLGLSLITLLQCSNDAASATTVSCSNLLRDSHLLTVLVGLLTIFPLCLMRDMTPLAHFSLLSVAAMIMVLGIVLYLYFFPPPDNEQQHNPTTLLHSNHTENPGFYRNWIEIRWNGYVQSLGTFVFSFVSQHMAHMAFASLKPELRTLGNWKRISSWSLGLACSVSLSIGLLAYITFWQAQGSDLFQMYPTDVTVIAWAKLLLCMTMVLTFPLPFFTCRELLIVLLVDRMRSNSLVCITRLDDAMSCLPTLIGEEEPCSLTLEEPLLVASSMMESEEEVESDDDRDPIVSHYAWLFRSEKELHTVYHVVLTFFLWLAALSVAIAAPNLGDVLALVGCVTGSAIAFVLPSLISFQLNGGSSFSSSSSSSNYRTGISALLFIVGATVLVLGSYYSGKKLLQDVTVIFFSRNAFPLQLQHL